MLVDTLPISSRKYSCPASRGSTAVSSFTVAAPFRIGFCWYRNRDHSPCAAPMGQKTLCMPKESTHVQHKLALWSICDIGVGIIALPHRKTHTHAVLDAVQRFLRSIAAKICRANCKCRQNNGFGVVIL
jgi:hypothetical protein